MSVLFKQLSLFVRLCYGVGVILLLLTSYASYSQTTTKAAVVKTTSGNPIFTGWYADPEGSIFRNKFWVFPTYSALYGSQLHFDAFSSYDLLTWTKHSKVLTNAKIKWAKQAMWAPAIVEKDKKFYFFFSANDIQKDGSGQPGGIGVAVADNPEGPYDDYIGKPLLSTYYNGAQPIDQFVFMDKDSSYYMIYGGHSHCNIVRLKNDFTGFLPLKKNDSTVIFKEITPSGYVEGPFMFFKNNKYYLMWSEGGWTGPDYKVAYAMSDSLLGPFVRIGTVLTQIPTIANGAGHHSVIHVPNSDDWYIVYHRRPVGSTDPNARQTCIDKMTFYADGKIKPVAITIEGVPKRQMIDLVPSTYRITAKACTKALQVNTVSGALDTADYRAGKNQQWVVNYISDSTYTIKALSGTKVLQVKDTSVLNNALIEEGDYTKLSFQEWNIDSLGGGYFKIINKKSNKALTIDTLLTGTELVQADYTGATTQQWLFGSLVLVTTNVSKLNENNAFSIYPNPANDMLYIRGIKESSPVQIFDLLGANVKNAIGRSVDVSDLLSGVYMAKVKLGSYWQSKLFVKR